MGYRRQNGSSYTQQETIQMLSPCPTSDQPATILVSNAWGRLERGQSVVGVARHGQSWSIISFPTEYFTAVRCKIGWMIAIDPSIGAMDVDSHRWSLLSQFPPGVYNRE